MAAGGRYLPGRGRRKRPESPEPRHTTAVPVIPHDRPVIGGSPMLKLKLFSLCSLVASMATVSGFCKTW